MFRQLLTGQLGHGANKHCQPLFPPRTVRCLYVPGTRQRTPTAGHGQVAAATAKAEAELCNPPRRDAEIARLPPRLSRPPGSDLILVGGTRAHLSRRNRLCRGVVREWWPQNNRRRGR